MTETTIMAELKTLIWESFITQTGSQHTDGRSRSADPSKSCA